MLPGIMINTGPNDFFPIEQMQLMKFNGEAGSCSATSSPARSGIRNRKERHHGVVPLFDPHYPGISGSTSGASWASDCCQPR